MRRNLFLGAGLGLVLLFATEAAQAACLARTYTGDGPTRTAATQRWAANVANFYGDLYSDWTYARKRMIRAIEGGWLATAIPCIPGGGTARQQPPPGPRGK
jgi:hypothetical protein